MFFFCDKVSFNSSRSDHIIVKYTLIIVDNQDVFRKNLKCVNDTARCKGNIGFPRSQVNFLPFTDFQPAALPTVHTRIKPFINKQALSDSGRTGGTLEPDVMDSIAGKTVPVQQISGLCAGINCFNAAFYFIPATGICVTSGITKIFPEHTAVSRRNHFPPDANPGQFPVLHTDIVFKSKLADIITILHISVSIYAVVFIYVILESHIDDTSGKLLSQMRKSHFRIAICFLIDLLQLGRFQAVV